MVRADAPTRSRRVCHRTAGSPSRSHSIVLSVDVVTVAPFESHWESLSRHYHLPDRHLVRGSASWKQGTTWSDHEQTHSGHRRYPGAARSPDGRHRTGRETAYGGTMARRGNCRRRV